MLRVPRSFAFINTHNDEKHRWWIFPLALDGKLWVMTSHCPWVGTASTTGQPSNVVYGCFCLLACFLYSYVKVYTSAASVVALSTSHQYEGFTSLHSQVL